MMTYMTPRAARPARASHRMGVLFAARRPVDLALRPPLRRAVQVANAGSSPWMANVPATSPDRRSYARKSGRPLFSGPVITARHGKQHGMLAIIAAILFAIAWIINATGTVTNAWFSVTGLLMLGLACLALHQAGIGSAWVRRR